MSVLPRSLPNALDKRDVLYGVKNSSTAELAELGKKFEAEDHLSDALDFFARSNTAADVERIEARALEEGDFFLYSRCQKILGRSDTEGRWRELGQKALEQKKYRYALRAFERGGLTDLEASVRELLANQPDIQAEEASKVFIPKAVATETV